MKTDKFDETLRKKIESIQPIFHEDDWQRFAAFAGAQAVPFWKSFWGKATLYSVGTTAFLGLIAYNITQYYAQKSLQNTIQSLVSQVDSLQRSRNVTLTEAPIPDTVYVTQYLPSVAPPNADNMAEKVELVTKNNVETAQDEVETTAKNEAKTELSVVDKTARNTREEPEPDRNETPVELARNESLASEIRENNSSVLAKKTRTKTEKNRADGVRLGPKNARTQKQKAGFDTPQAQPFGSESGGEISPPKIQIPAAGAPALVLEKLAIIGLDRSNKMKVAEPNVPPPTAHYEAPKPPKATFVWPTLTARIGLGASVSAGYFSPNLTTELFVGKRVSISTGLTINYFESNKYFTDEQFFKKNRRDFRETYAPKAPPVFEILNISERSYVVQIPVRLNYYQPIASGFWLLGSVGTDLDIYGSKRVSFDLRESRSEFKEVINAANLPVVLLNNLVLSAGVEKRLGNFGLQLSPYWVVNINKKPYRQNIGGFGGQLRLLYRF